MAYTKTTFVDDNAPGMNAEYLNNLEDKIYEFDTKTLRVYPASYSIILDSGETQIGEGLDSSKNIFMAKLTVEYDDGSYIGRSPEFNLFLEASSTNPGQVIVAKPHSLDTTRYPILYRFAIVNNKKVLYATAPSGLNNHRLYVDYYYAE